jgi:hypothetical protein
MQGWGDRCSTAYCACRLMNLWEWASRGRGVHAVGTGARRAQRGKGAVVSLPRRDRGTRRVCTARRRGGLPQ